MSRLLNERTGALLLIAAAVLGLVLANTTVGPSLLELKASHLDIPAVGISLSLGHWITDGLLAIFFFLAAIELRHEFEHGELDSPRKALIPAIAAVGGVIAPALIFLAIVRDPEQVAGWPIPTATDIAFALGVLALVGKGLPRRFRALLLALAVIDDLIAILIIAFFFTSELNPMPLLIAVPVVLLFGAVTLRRPAAISARITRVVLLVVLGVAAWYLVFQSGVHSTIAGVALGLIASSGTGARALRLMQPWSDFLILPLFAFTAAMVVLPSGEDGGLTPMFWAIIIALPVGKVIGISLGALLARRLAAEPDAPRVVLADVISIAALGGIGLTVSLLMTELAYSGNEELISEGTLAVLLGSGITAMLGGGLIAWRAWHYRNHPPATDEESGADVEPADVPVPTDAETTTPLGPHSGTRVGESDDARDRT